MCKSTHSLRDSRAPLTARRRFFYRYLFFYITLTAAGGALYLLEETLTRSEKDRGERKGEFGP